MKLSPYDFQKVEKAFGPTILEFTSYLDKYAEELNKEFLEGEDPRKPVFINEFELPTN